MLHGHSLCGVYEAGTNHTGIIPLYVERDANLTWIGRPIFTATHALHACHAKPMAPIDRRVCVRRSNQQHSVARVRSASRNGFLIISPLVMEQKCRWCEWGAA